MYVRLTGIIYACARHLESVALFLQACGYYGNSLRDEVDTIPVSNSHADVCCIARFMYRLSVDKAR